MDTTYKRRGIIMLNAGAAVDQKREGVGQGIVASNKHLGFGNDSRRRRAEIEEANAIRTALMKAKEEGWMRIMIQSDDKKVVNKIKVCGTFDPVIGTKT